MDIKQYSKEVMQSIDSLTDEQFDKLLIEAGIEKCPLEKIEIPSSFSFTIFVSRQEAGTYKESNLYSTDSVRDSFVLDLKVA